MGIEQDYISRVLSQFFDELNVLIGRMHTEDEVQLNRDLDELYNLYFKQTSVFFRSADIDEIKDLVITNDDKRSMALCEMLSELLFTDGISQYENDLELGLGLLKKSLNLLYYVDDHSEDFSIVRASLISKNEERIASIKALKES